MSLIKILKSGDLRIDPLGIPLVTLVQSLNEESILFLCFRKLKQL